MADRNGLAYDLSVYEPKPKTKAKPSPAENRAANIEVNRNSGNLPKRDSAFKVLLMAFAILAILCYVLYGYVETNSLFREISKLETELKNLEAENITLAAEYEARTSLKNVEDYAENVLGLRKLDKTQIEYIDLPGNTVIEKIDTENRNIFIIIRNKINELREYLGG